MKFLWAYAIGMLTAYLWWRLPVHIQMYKEYRARKVRREVERIEGGISTVKYIPNTPPPPFVRMRILEYCRRWWDETSPRTPEEVAYAVYQQRLRR